MIGNLSKGCKGFKGVMVLLYVLGPLWASRREIHHTYITSPETYETPIVTKLYETLTDTKHTRYTHDI